jgi:hypothetical protein
MTYEIGDRVEKHTGGYTGPGILRGISAAADGSPRYLVGHKIEGGAGEFLHVYTARDICYWRPEKEATVPPMQAGIDAMCTAVIEPTFENGKCYRTAGGHTMKIRRVGDGLIGAEQDAIGNRAIQSLMSIMYHWSGTPLGTGWGEYQLLPGAIEDEPKADKLDVDTLDRLDAQVGDLFRQLRGVRERLNQIEEPNSLKLDEIKDTADTARREIAVLASGMNKQSQRIDGIAMAQTSQFERQETLLKRMGELGGNANARTDTDTAAAWKTSEAYIAAVNAMCKAVPRTIKGGWVNVYRSSVRGGDRWFSDPHDTRQEANTNAALANSVRLACILIPDMDKAHQADPNANREWFAEEWEFALTAPMEVLIPMMLARYAGLRGQTAVVVSWKLYRDHALTGKAFRFTAAKNDEKGFVPVMPELQSFLASIKVRTKDGLIALRDDGTPWESEKDMQTRVSHWLRDRERDGLIGSGTTLHGLRVSYAAWWKRHGANNSEVASW